MAGPVFITGGSGFVGGAIVEALLAEGRAVRALTRSRHAAAALHLLGAEPVPGDVLDEASLVEAMAGCDVVYHAAGLNEPCPRDPAHMHRVNLGGSVHVVRAAAASGARRVVHTSSAAAIGEAPGTVGREDTPHRGWFLSSYERSKFEAERAVLAAAGDLGLEVVCVNPSSVQGPGRVTGTARFLVAAARGRLPFVVDARLSFVDVADCARGHLLAERHGVPGERYLLSGATLTTREGLGLVARVAGIRPRAVAVPPWAAEGLAAFVEVAARAVSRTPPACREAARVLRHGHAYDGSRAQRDLGLRYRPIEETLRRTLEWYVDRGIVPPLPGLGGRPRRGTRRMPARHLDHDTRPDEAQGER